MVTTIPQPLDDQTIESLVAVAWSRNSWPTWPADTHSIFDAPGIIKGSLVHIGVARCYQTFLGFGYESPDALVSSHCPLPLLKPFLDVLLYESVQRSMIAGRRNSFIKFHALHAITPDLRFCRSCIEADAHLHGYAYARRAHQIKGVQVCHAHARPLHRLRAEQSDHFARHGILMLPLEGAGSSCNLLEIPLTGSHSVAMKYAGFAAAALTGTLQPTPTSRQLAYLERLRTRPGGDRAPARILTRELRQEFGDTLLEDLGLNPTAGPNASWPAMILYGSAYSQHPLANLLVMSILFAGPEDFRQAVCHQLDRHQEHKVGTNPQSLRHSGAGLSLRLIKEFLRERYFNKIEKIHGIPQSALRQLLYAFPKLQQRRAEALWRQKRRKARSEVLGFFSRMLTAKQSDPYKKPNDRDLLWLLRNDRQWLDALLAFNLQKQPRMEQYDVKLDSKVAAEVGGLLGRLDAEGSRYTRRSRANLIGRLSQDSQAQIGAGRLPIARASLKSLVESEPEHINRCIASIWHLLLCGDQECARKCASELLFAYPNKPKLHNRVLTVMPSLQSQRPPSVAI